MEKLSEEWILELWAALQMAWLNFSTKTQKIEINVVFIFLIIKENLRTRDFHFNMLSV